MQRKIEQIIFLISFPLSFFGFILPLYASSMGATPMKIGLLFSVFSLTSIVMRPLVGAYIDRAGRKRAFLMGLSAYAAVQGLLWLGRGYGWLLLARIIQSAGSSLLWVSAYAMIADISKNEEYAGNYGSLLQASNRGDFIGCFIGFTLLYKLGETNALSSIFTIFFGISLYALLRGTRELKETYTVSTTKTEPDPKVTPQFLVYILLVGLLSLTGSMVAPVFLVYIKERLAVSILLISLAYIPAEILDIVLPKKVGKWTDQYGRKRFMILGLTLNAVFVCFWPSAHSIVGFALLSVILAIANTLTSPARVAIVSAMTHNNRFGRAYGYYYTATGIGGALGPMIGTYIYEKLSGDLLFYINCAATLLMAIAVYFLLQEPKITQKSTHHNAL